MREGEQNRVARAKSERGIPAEVEQFSAWRATARADNQWLLDFYGRYLVGQYAGMGQALSLDAVRAACDIEGIDRRAWPDIAGRLMILHAAYVDALPKDK
jgi:hypothetical protein